MFMVHYSAKVSPHDIFDSPHVNKDHNMKVKLRAAVVRLAPSVIQQVSLYVRTAAPAHTHAHTKLINRPHFLLCTLNTIIV